jgi:hypothetical protein
MLRTKYTIIVLHCTVYIFASCFLVFFSNSSTVYLQDKEHKKTNNLDLIVQQLKLIFKGTIG